MVYDTNILVALLLEEVTCYNFPITNLPLYDQTYKEYNKIRSLVNKNNGSDKYDLSDILNNYKIVVSSEKFNKIYQNLKSTTCIQVFEKTRGIDSLDEIFKGITSTKIDISTEVFDKREGIDFIKS